MGVKEELGRANEEMLFADGFDGALIGYVHRFGQMPIALYNETKIIEILMDEPQRVQKLRDNTAYARQGIRDAGFDVLESPTAICPIIVGDTAKAIAMSNRLLQMGVFVIGFGYPVVPEGTARLRAQVSAAHEKEHLDQLIESMTRLKAEVG